MVNQRIVGFGIVLSDIVGQNLDRQRITDSMDMRSASDGDACLFSGSGNRRELL